MPARDGGGRERGCSSRRGGFESAEPLILPRELVGESAERELRVLRTSRDLLVLLRGASEVVECRDRLVERLGAEHDRDWIVGLLLVQGVYEERKLSL